MRNYIPLKSCKLTCIIRGMKWCPHHLNKSIRRMLLKKYENMLPVISFIELTTSYWICIC